MDELFPQLLLAAGVVLGGGGRESFYRLPSQPVQGGSDPCETSDYNHEFKKRRRKRRRQRERAGESSFQRGTLF